MSHGTATCSYMPQWQHFLLALPRAPVEKPRPSRKLTSAEREDTGKRIDCSVVIKSAGRSCAPISPLRTSPGSASSTQTCANIE